MAAELSKRGITNVKVLEKSNRTCGKIESPKYNGAVHELGACWLSSSYKWVRALFEGTAFS
jgi:protoporphyrinogen oxidase